MRKLIVVIMLIAIVSCGSSERVITDDGKVYEVKGNNFYTKGEDVTNTLTEIEKKRIQTTLENRLKSEEALAKKQDQISESLKELKQKEKELKEKQNQLDNTENNRKEARDDFFKIRENLNDVKQDYQLLKDKGELSPKDDAKWQKRLVKLERKLKEAEIRINR